MKNPYLKSSLLLFAFVIFVVSCKNTSNQPKEALATTAPDLKNVQVTLPAAAGSQTFNANCVICHSAALVFTQPDFPEKTWTSIVTKMQKVYGAPVSDSAAKIIIQYLSTVKGRN